MIPIPPSYHPRSAGSQTCVNHQTMVSGESLICFWGFGNSMENPEIVVSFARHFGWPWGNPPVWTSDRVTLAQRSVVVFAEVFAGSCTWPMCFVAVSWYFLMYFFWFSAVVLGMANDLFQSCKASYGLMKSYSQPIGYHRTLSSILISARKCQENATGRCFQGA